MDTKEFFVPECLCMGIAYHMDHGIIYAMDHVKAYEIVLLAQENELLNDVEATKMKDEIAVAEKIVSEMEVHLSYLNRKCEKCQ